jgi:hypothetical protein
MAANASRTPKEQASTKKKERKRKKKKMIQNHNALFCSMSYT